MSAHTVDGGAGDAGDPGVSAGAGAGRRRRDTPAVPDADNNDQASADPGVPSDSLRIVSREPRRMGQPWAFDCHRSVRNLQVIICVFFFIILLLAIVVGYLRVLAMEPVVPAPITAAGSCAKPTPRVCDRPGCVLRAAETVLFLNRSADPCGDFYSYACGGFSAAHPTGVMRPLGVRQLLERRNRERLLELLREEQYFNTSSTSATGKARVFFTTCMSSYERGINSVDTLVDLLSRFGGLELFGTWTIRQRKTRAVYSYKEETQFDFNDVLSNTTFLHPEQAFFGVRYDRQLNVLALGLPKLAMGFVEAVTQPGSVAHDQLTSRVRSEMRLVLAHLEHDMHSSSKPRSCNNSCINIMVEDVIAVQDALAVLRPDFATAETAAPLMSLSELSELVPQIDWRRMLDQLYGEGVVPDTVTVQVPSSNYMAGIGRIIDNTRFQRLYHFLVWPVIRSFLVGLGPVYATLSEQLDHEFHVQRLKTREQQCLALLEKHMAPALRGLFLSSHIGEKNVPLVLDLLKQARDPLIDSLTWMTENSRRNSRDLLDIINIDFGDPASVFGPLDDYYSPLRFNSLETSFFHNLKQLYGFTPPVRVVRGPLFDDTPLESATIRYDVDRQTLTIPYGALQRPWFDADVPAPLNAAALGSYIYDAFAVPFFLFNMDVNETFNWDNETLWRLNEFTSCLTDVIKMQPVHQEYVLALSTSVGVESTEHRYKSFSAPFEAEVVAFLLSREYFSYHLSHRLYNLLAQQEPDVTLPGLHLNSSSQSFYLAFAQARCHNGNPEREHFFDYGNLWRLPQKIAVNSLVHSDPEFREAFQCGSRRPVKGASRAVGSCQLLKWPTDDASSAPATSSAEKM